MFSLLISCRSLAKDLRPDLSAYDVDFMHTPNIQKLADTKAEDISAMYTMGDELGRGRFSVVQAAVHKKEGAKYAIKVVENDSLGDEENLEALETEVRASACAQPGR